MKKIFVNFCFILILLNSCTKVTNLSDEAKLTDFKIQTVTPSEIELGAPEIKGDTIYIPVLRGISLFPMSISALPEYSAETEQVVPGTSFKSFNDIKFDLEDIELNKFYVVAKSGQTKPYYINLLIEDQENQNDFKELNITGTSQSNILISPKGFVNPVKRTITLYAIEATFPLEINASAVLSENAYIKAGGNMLEKELLVMSFKNFGDHVSYTVEAENGAIQEWEIFLNKAVESNGTESSDILASLSLNSSKQTAEIKTSGYKLNDVFVNNQDALITYIVAPLSRSLNVEIVPTLTTLINSQIMGYKVGESVIFENYNSKNSFYVLDGRSGYYKTWNFYMMEGGIGEITGFTFTNKDNSSSGKYTEIDATSIIDNVNKLITLNVIKSTTLASYWPVTVTATEVACTDGATVEIAPLVFKNINDSTHFKVKNTLGEDIGWTVKLFKVQTSTKAEIDSVRILNSSYPIDNVIVYKNSNDVFIDLKDRKALPLRIQPHIYVSAGANFEDFQNGNFMEFNSFTDTIKINVIAQSGDIVTWKLQLMEKSQLYNSNFDLWKSATDIDPIPGTGRGWATANNLYIKGTSRTENSPYGYAAQLKTDIVSFPANLITSATLFLGTFKLSIADMGNPRKMTYFGVPFEARPEAVSIDVKYIPGPVYQESVHTGGSGLSSKYVLEDRNGEDRGHIWIELLHWEGPGNIDYHATSVEGLHILARGEYVASKNENWIKVTIPLEKWEDYNKYQPTHLAVAMASSIGGHLFIGSKGSVLTVDNFELIY